MGRTGIFVSFASIGQPRQRKVLELGGEVVHDVGGEAVGILGGNMVWQNQVWQGIKCNMAPGVNNSPHR